MMRGLVQRYLTFIVMRKPLGRPSLLVAAHFFWRLTNPAGHGDHELLIFSDGLPSPFRCSGRTRRTIGKHEVGRPESWWELEVRLWAELYSGRASLPSKLFYTDVQCSSRTPYYPLCEGLDPSKPRPEQEKQTTTCRTMSEASSQTQGWILMAMNCLRLSEATSAADQFLTCDGGRTYRYYEPKHRVTDVKTFTPDMHNPGVCVFSSLERMMLVNSLFEKLQKLRPEEAEKVLKVLCRS